jgi:hypothetical protein
MVDELMFILILKMLLFYLTKIDWLLESQKAETIAKQGLHRKTPQNHKNIWRLKGIG